MILQKKNPSNFALSFFLFLLTNLVLLHFLLHSSKFIQDVGLILLLLLHIIMFFFPPAFSLMVLFLLLLLLPCCCYPTSPWDFTRAKLSLMKLPHSILYKIHYFCADKISAEMLPKIIRKNNIKKI